MQCKIIVSKNSSLYSAIEEIDRQYEVEMGIDGYDFLLIALSPHYPTYDINETIARFFDPEKVCAFHAIDSFCNEQIISHGITALFIKFERKGSISYFIQEEIGNRQIERLEQTADYLKSHHDAQHIIIGGLCSNRFAFFIEKLNHYDIPVDNLIGGISSGNTFAEEALTYQFHNGQIIKDGFIILSFHNVSMSTEISTGFVPIGVQYTVTKANGYKIFEVDESQSFLYTIEKLTRDIEEFKPEYLWYTPLVIIKDQSEELITLRTFKEMGDGWVEFYGPVKEGQKIKLSYGESTHLLKADRESAYKLAETLPEPELLFNFSCIARQYVLEDHQCEENQMYRNYLHAPLFGFFTFGEIGHDEGKKSLQFYNETSLLIGVAEK